MTAMEGGSVACFVVRVLETLQYLSRGRDITSLFFPPEWVVSAHENFSQNPLDYARCVWQNQGSGGRKCGAPPNFEGCGPDLSVGDTHSLSSKLRSVGGATGTYL